MLSVYVVGKIWSQVEAKFTLTTINKQGLETKPILSHNRLNTDFM